MQLFFHALQSESKTERIGLSFARRHVKPSSLHAAPKEPASSPRTTENRAVTPTSPNIMALLMFMAHPAAKPAPSPP